MRLVVATTLALLIAPGFPSGAQAFDFFGLFGSSEKPPTPSSDTVPYKVEFSGLGDAKDLEQPLKDGSTLWRLRNDATPSGDAVARRAQADIPALAQILWAEGYYDAVVHVRVANVAIDTSRDNAAAAKAAEAYRARDLAPVAVDITLGVQYHIGDVRYFEMNGVTPLPADLLPTRRMPLQPGEPARAATVRVGAAKIVDHLRELSRPLAKLMAIAPVINHNSQTVDLAITVSPGPVAGIGEVTVSGTKNVDPRVVHSFIYLEPGEAYSPERLAMTRKSVAKIEAIGGVRINEAPHLDANGNLPLDVVVSERAEHAVGASGLYSNTDGPAVNAYWVDRNLFGGAERLRFDLTGGLAPLTSTPSFNGQTGLGLRSLIGQAKASFLKPALGGSRNDLLIDASLSRVSTTSYLGEIADATAAIRHRFSNEASVQAGVEFQRGHIEDAFGTHDYTLVGLPLSALYDSTDKPLDPSLGIRAQIQVTPYQGLFGSSASFVQSKAQLSAYHAFDEDARVILAGRLAVGSLAGASLIDIPAPMRFFAGGGGSVRGFYYQSLSPLGPGGAPVGGRSLLEMSGEARIKVTDTIGVVPFVDAGNAYADSIPDFKGGVRVAAGLGLRYYTAIGPIRLDVATPISPQRGDPPIAVYLGLGQSF